MEIKITKEERNILDKLLKEMPLVSADLTYISFVEMEKKGVLDKKGIGVYQVTEKGKELLESEGETEGEMIEETGYKEITKEERKIYRIVINIVCERSLAIDLKDSVNEQFKNKLKDNNYKWNVKLEQKV